MHYKVYFQGVPVGTIGTETLMTIRHAVRSDPTVYVRQISCLAAAGGRVLALLVILVPLIVLWLGVTYLALTPHDVLETLNNLLQDQGSLLEGSTAFLAAYLVIALTLIGTAFTFAPDALGLTNAFADAFHFRLRQHLGIPGNHRLTLVLERGAAELSTHLAHPNTA